MSVIVIFGAAVRPDGSPSTTLRRRVEAAAAFAARQTRTCQTGTCQTGVYQTGVYQTGAWFVPTGGIGRHGPSEASVMAGLLEGLGVLRERIVLEETATDTLSSVRAVIPLIRTVGEPGPVRVATSFYHLPRCLLLLRLAGVRAKACPPPAYPSADGLMRRWYWRLREIPAVVLDVILILALRASGRLERQAAR